MFEPWVLGPLQAYLTFHDEWHLAGPAVSLSDPGQPPALLLDLWPRFLSIPPKQPGPDSWLSADRGACDPIDDAGCVTDVGSFG